MKKIDRIALSGFLLGAVFVIFVCFYAFATVVVNDRKLQNETDFGFVGAVGGIYHPTGSASVCLIAKENKLDDIFEYKALTAYHVVNKYKDVTDIIPAGFSFRDISNHIVEFETVVTIGKSNESLDVVILTFRANADLPIFELDMDYEYHLGNKVYLASCPNQQFVDLGDGIITALSNAQTSYSKYSGIECSNSFFKVSFPSVFGSSGGAIVNSDGKLIGIIKAYGYKMDDLVLPIVSIGIKITECEELLK